MKTILFCLVVIFALLGSSYAFRPARNLQEVKAAKGDATTNTVGGGQNCHYYWDCYWTTIPGIGEEEICNQVQVCD